MYNKSACSFIYVYWLAYANRLRPPSSTTFKERRASLRQCPLLHILSPRSCDQVYHCIHAENSAPTVFCTEGQLIHTVSNNESVRLADGIKLNKIFEIQIGSLKIDFNGYALKTAGVSPEAPSLVKSVNVFGVKEMQRLWSLVHGSIRGYHPFSKHQLCNYKRNFSWRIHCPFSHKLEQSIS